MCSFLSRIWVNRLDRDPIVETVKEISPKEAANRLADKIWAKGVNPKVCFVQLTDLSSGGISAFKILPDKIVKCV